MLSKDSDMLLYTSFAKFYYAFEMKIDNQANEEILVDLYSWIKAGNENIIWPDYLPLMTLKLKVHTKYKDDLIQRLKL